MPQSLPETHARFSAAFVVVPKVVSRLGVVVSGLVLLGWTLNLPILQSILPGQPQMVPLTAVAFILASLSLATKPKVVSGICALAVILIAEIGRASCRERV